MLWNDAPYYGDPASLAKMVGLPAALNYEQVIAAEQARLEQERQERVRQTQERQERVRQERARQEQERQERVIAKQKRGKNDNRIVIRNLVIGAIVGAIVGAIIGGVFEPGGIGGAFEGGTIAALYGVILGVFTGIAMVLRKY